MKRTLYTAVCLMLAMPAANAGLLIDVYGGVNASVGNAITYIPNGTGLPSAKDLKSSAGSFGATFGVDIPVVRIEAEYGYLAGKNMNLHTGMANLYLKILPTPIVKPYIGAGIGTVFAGKVKGDIDEDIDQVMAYQGMVGLQFDIPATPLFIDIEGRAFYADALYEFPVVNKEIGYLQYDARLKLRYVF